jgi:hypothetical protein
MSGPAGLVQVISSEPSTGSAFGTFTTAKRVINGDCAMPFPGNYFKLGARFKYQVRGALSNVVTTPGTVTFQIMMGSVATPIIAWTSGALTLNATARTNLPFTLDVDLRVATVGPTTSATFIGMGTFGGVHLTNTDQTIQVPTTAPAAGTGWDSESSAGNVLDFYVGFSNSQAGNNVTIYFCDIIQLSGLAP